MSKERVGGHNIAKFYYLQKQKRHLKLKDETPSDLDNVSLRLPVRLTKIINIFHAKLFPPHSCLRYIFIETE